MWNRVREQARSLTPSKTAGSMLLAPFWLTGIIIGSLLTVTWTAISWAWASTAVGLKQATHDKLPHADPAIVAQWLLVILIAVGLIVWVLR